MAAMKHAIGHAQLQKEYALCLSKGLTPYVRSSPGIGKSDSAHQFAKEFNLKVIDIRLSQCTPEDLQGFPMRDGNKATFTPFDIFPLEGEDLPEELTPDGKVHKYDGWLLLLDELSSANKAVQAAAYKLILDKQVGSYKLHPRCAMIACGNNIEDKAVVHRMSTALQSRMTHYDLEITTQDWIKWATQNNIDFRIQAFVQFKQGMLMNFKPDHTDNTYACPRTWEFLNRLIKDEATITREHHIARVAGTVGAGAGYEFLTFCEVQSDIPDWADITNPAINSKITPPAEASAKYATICWIANEAKKTELAALIPYVQQFGADLQVIFCRGILHRFKNVDKEIPEFGKYSMSLIADINSI
jgi:hypothetical protein